ncbi:Calcium-transporting ATPase [Ferriphaselus amnicola]|uniref:P-type Cu(+) transporter n=1 Tax=Ferriphaselus amnicola TaxID=1188319 RepID=A0A2Z6G9F8_9PROT|nr:cation-translocating P-type ATPase [Ferriphaselus amnicola]BBE50117.1 Calcium-transporting ATPase [Ferriphaselus amnicola]
MMTIDRPAEPRGLSHAEAKARLHQEGANELAMTGQRNIQAIALEVLREPMFLLLVGAGAIYLLLGDVSDALMLLGFVFVVMGITIYQEYKTERVLEALRDLTSPRALVIRDGVEQRIAGREVVRGDVLILAEGDRVPADAALLSCNDFAADESLLTGESVAVRKLAQAEIGELQPPGGDDLPFVYSGTLVVQGRGVAQVLATGAHTEIGKIGRALQEQETEATPLQREIAKLVRKLAILGVLLSLSLLLIYGLSRGDWLRGLLSGITLAMSILPEEYPVVLTIFMAMGAWRISRHRVLTRRVPTVEALGSATVLCVDKTGTLTQNRMVVQQLIAAEASFSIHADTTPLPEAFHELVEFGILSSETEPFDPMEKSIHACGTRYLANTEHLHGDWALAHEYSLSPELLALSHVWKAKDRKEFVVASKGAPEAVADLCHLDAAQLAQLAEQVNSLAAQGMRVLGVARARWQGDAWPDIQHDFEFEFLGLIGLADPVRPTVTAALKECKAAGIRVVMITGDYPATAAAIAQQIGLDAGSGGVISGSELNLMDESTLRARIVHSNIYARMVPEQKLRLVNALKANGEIVAMTGDGVNDAPALKAAHIGIAMGARGTDVAREAAALVLLDDDFASIVHAVRIGRGIFDNLRKAMAYIFAVHLPIAGLSLIPLLLGWPPVFAPVHIVFLEMIINPACSIAFEAEPAERGVMHRPPRSPQEPLFGQRIVLLSLLQGVFVLLAALAVLGYSLGQGVSENEARALTFSTLVVGSLGLILTNRSWQHSLLHTFDSPNPALWWVIGGAFSFLLLALSVPFLRDVFHFAPLTPPQFLLSFASGAASIVWFELYKLLHRH